MTAVAWPGGRGSTSYGTPSALTASTTQSQGQQQFSAANTWYKITTGNANDVCTMPSGPNAGDWVLVDNRGAETLQLYPDTGDNFYGLAANASTTIASGVSVKWIFDGSEWISRG